MKRKKILNTAAAIAISLSICCIPDNIPCTNFAMISETNAADSNITFDEENVSLTYSLGDVNTDGIIDGRDATAVLTYYAKSSVG